MSRAAVLQQQQARTSSSPRRNSTASSSSSHAPFWEPAFRPQFGATAMPLSRTRSLLANINGAASATPTHSLGGGATNHDSANHTAGGVAETTSIYALPSLSGAAAADHLLPPLKGSGLGLGTPTKPSSSSSATAPMTSSSTAATPGKNSASNQLFSRDNANTSSTSHAHHLGTHHPFQNGHAPSSSISGASGANGSNLELDNMSTTGSILSASNMTASTALTNGTTAGTGNGGGTGQQQTGTGSSSAGSLHLNGMQTLPHVRQSSTSEHLHQQNGNSTMESPKHHHGSSTGSSAPTNGSTPTVSNSSNSSNSNNVKPKTMVATPEQVMKLYMNKLTPYEHHEIFNYPQIYFIGANAKKRPGIIGAPNNCGYDDDQGSYTHIPHDHLAYRYEVLKVIGKGSFGQVVKAYDHKNHHHVALKMVRNEKRFHRQAQEEIRILEHLRKQDKDNTFNIIHLYDHFTFRSHTCITFELLSINLYELIKKNKFQGFSLQLVRKFAHSLLQCLDLLHRNKIIHCDMKPENVLLKQQGRSGIKVRRKLHLPY